MSPKLPPPDPHESLGLTPPGDVSVALPTAVFLRDGGTAEAERLSDAILDLRPGVLVVCAAG
jgi:hypothetical protein